jgi:hypothetical protein
VSCIVIIKVQGNKSGFIVVNGEAGRGHEVLQDAFENSSGMLGATKEKKRVVGIL